MDPHTILTTYGGWGLLALSFVAATLVPLSSEAALFGALKMGMPPLEALVWASVGNCLGVAFNYALGRWGSTTVLRRPLESRGGRRALAWSERYGKWSLLLSWAPIVGDPLTIVAGVLRVNMLFFAVVALGTRVARYGLLVALV